MYLRVLSTTACAMRITRWWQKIGSPPAWAIGIILRRKSTFSKQQAIALPWTCSHIAPRTIQKNTASVFPSFGLRRANRRTPLLEGAGVFSGQRGEGDGAVGAGSHLVSQL